MIPADAAAPADELERLRERNRKLAEDKSYYQLVLRLMELLNPLPGLQDMLRGMLANIVECIGGTNIKLYYWIGEELHYIDFLGENRRLDDVDDHVVEQVVKTHEFVEQLGGTEEALLKDGALRGSWTWTFPLLVGQELVGVIKLENLHIHGATLGKYLPIFCSHAALILSNEIRNYKRQQAEKALAESEARVQRLIKQVPIALAYVSKDGRIASMNDRFTAVFGYSPADVPTLDDWWLRAYPDPVYRRWVLDTWNTAVREASDKGTDIRPVEYQVTCKDGDVRVMEISGVTFGADFLATFIDLTERKRVEEELERHRLHLEELVAVRTRELAEARDAAEAASRAKGIFLANMSHELRTPLNAVLGFAQLLERDQRLPADNRGYVQAIGRSGRHLLALINDVLEISRIEAGRLKMHPAAVDLQELLATLRESVEVRAREKGLGLRLVAADGLPPFVATDGGKLRQILLNLLSNAVKYTSAGEIELTAAAEAQGQGLLLRFSVRDTGAGIAAGELEKIFQPFFQTDYGAALGEGSGLGLTISREYAQLLGGALTVESEPGRGSVFRLTVPVGPAAAPAPAEGGRGPVIGLYAGQPVRVLAVDDDADSRQLLEEMLRRAEFQVRSVSDGAQAVEAFRDWRPDFIWMDMRMPVMDGYEATRRIRALSGGGKVRIAALTASAFREDREQIIAAGCDEVLAKPVDEDHLFAAMGRLLGLRYRHAEPVAAETAAGGADLSGLAADLRAELCRAADALDVEATAQAIDRIRATAPALADQLAGMARGYRFDRIVALCSAAAAGDA